MPDQEDRYKDIDKLLNKIANEEENIHNSLNLRELFDNRVVELGITPTYVLEILRINYRALEGILDGTQKRIDFITLSKLARFLGIPTNEVVNLYIKSLEENNLEDIQSTDKRTFITNTFDLTVLRTMGVIQSINDFDHIEKQITSIFELASLEDYDTEKIEAAFSSASIKPRNAHTRAYFIKKSEAIFKLINNPFKYEKQAVIDYFPKIRWHSTDIENGLPNVIRSLYKLGITIIFQPKMPSLHLRGATFAVNNKPCIVLTDYKGFYPTLWFALIHELFHVVFDWEDIVNKEYHLSDEENDLFVLKQKEDEANEFAREFLFPKAKMEKVSQYIDKRDFIREFALDNHVHPSVIYANYAYDNDNGVNKLWAHFQKFMPDITNLLSSLGNSLGHTGTVREYADFFKSKLLNVN